MLKNQIFFCFVEEILECAVCEAFLAALESLLKNKEVDASIEHKLEQSCHSIPGRFYDRVSFKIKIKKNFINYF